MSALLLQVAVKASVVFLATWIVTMTMRRQSAAARHLVWTLGISVGRLDADRTAHRCRSDTGGRTVNGSGRCSGE